LIHLRCGLCETLGYDNYDDADAKLDLTGAKLRKIWFRRCT